MSIFADFQGGHLMPGTLAALEAVENQFWLGFVEQHWFLPGCPIDGAARDAGNTVTDVLRAGLLMGQVTSSKKFKEWSPTATDGSQYIYGPLAHDLKMTAGGTNYDRVGVIMVRGQASSKRIIVPGVAAEGISGTAREYQIAIELSKRIILDEHLLLNDGKTVALPASVTLTGLDHGGLFTDVGAGGATTIVLPAPQPGLQFSFLSTTAHDRIIAPAGADNVVGTGGADLDTVTLEDIGDYVQFTGISTTLYGITGSIGAPVLA